jgi:hypothetical protein
VQAASLQYSSVQVQARPTPGKSFQEKKDQEIGDHLSGDMSSSVRTHREVNNLL